ncbi:AAA family ATPase [Mucilaginibacter aquariorum]|uniref:AAA family ATPase n=1 Tax=Mucilaginibacter aquariorum TaxID=2967225 RepID=A0ABT1SXB4_9SPHI|nr:AAA family ATPase [Mucilaginibacter aquariorum]MCQ6956989.1 AAA family ATPase [Mucilaginibacter aquariorum]
MIQSIAKLTKFGIFQNYKPTPGLLPFNKNNLFYGWNGSGKSTLAKLFYSVNDKAVHKDFDTCEFLVTIKDHVDVTQKNIGENAVNIHVFNKDFIERNVNFEQSKANSIIILSEEKKEDMDNYKKLISENETKKDAHKKADGINNKAEDDLKKSLSKWASSIKKSFELIETNNNYYLNYDRTKLTKFIKDNKAAISKDSVLLPDIVKDLKNAIKPTQKEDIYKENIIELSLNNVLAEFDSIENLVAKSIFSNQISRLIANPDINLWVQEGLSIHNEYKSANCEFCNQKLPVGTISKLNEHFSVEYTKLIDDLAKAKVNYEHLAIMVHVKCPETIELYDEYHPEYILAKAQFELDQRECGKLIVEAVEKIELKLEKPFGIIAHKFSNVNATFENFNKSLKGLLSIIDKHNLKNQQFDEEVKKGQQKLELHFVSDILLTEKYADTEKLIEDQRVELVVQAEALVQLDANIKAIEAILINEAVGAHSFNESLFKFIGRKDISIEFDSALKGYKLKRGGKASPATNLSEGEKTAIAFIYFISKLKENGNKIENSIILVDDPISSFDSNHLFHSYSYLKKECEQALQLFVFTHNFQYFKLIRDWLIKKNKKDKIKSHFYSIDCTTEENRTSSINNANSTLLEFNSEYHYIFYKLHALKSLISLDLEKAFLIANLSRKLLEAFLSFKFPKGRNDFNQLLEAGCSDAEVREKVYRFINKYSHNQQIEFHETPIDNLLGEGDNIIHHVLEIVEKLDKAHYDEMEEVCKSNLVA